MIKNSIKYGHYNCLLCGDNNPWSLGLDYKLLDDGRVFTLFKGNKSLQGYKGILHGGVISALLDSAMVHCLFNHDIEAVTAEMTIRFMESIPYNTPLKLYGLWGTYVSQMAESPVFYIGNFPMTFSYSC